MSWDGETLFHACWQYLDDGKRQMNFESSFVYPDENLEIVADARMRVYLFVNVNSSHNS